MYLRARSPWYLLALALLGADTTAWAEIVPIARLRDITSFATIQPIEGETLFDSDQIQTQDPGTFDEVLELGLTLGDAAAGAEVFQTSGIEENSLFAFGGFTASSTLGSTGEFAEALGASRLNYRFHVTIDTPTRLFGVLVSSGNGVASAVLVGPSGVLLNLTVFDDLVDFTEDLVLEAGNYELSVSTSGYGQALPNGEFPASGSFELFLDPDAPASVEPAEVARSAPEILPHPITRDAEIRFAGPAPEGRRLTVVAADGRVVRDLGAWAGESLRWDTRDDRGSLVPGGVYFIRTQGTNGATRALVVR